MNIRSAFAAVSCLAVALAVFTFAAYVTEPKAAPHVALRWEHLALTHNDGDVGNDGNLSQRIVRLGDQGWERINCRQGRHNSEDSILFQTSQIPVNVRLSLSSPKRKL